MNLKALYDQVLKADAARNLVAQDIVRLNDEGKYDEALALQDKLDTAKKNYESANRLYLSMLEVANDGTQQGNAQRFVPLGGQPEPQEIQDLRASKDYLNQWMQAFRNGVTPKTIKGGLHSAEAYPLLVNALTETGGSPAGEDGGFLNPIDFDNQIRELMREYVDLANFVNVENVTTLTGWRVIEQFAAALPLTKVTTELEVREDNEEGESPKFNKVDYTLEEYFDFLRVGNSLMQDTPINLMAYLSRWFAKKVVLTNNSLVLALLNAIAATDVTDYTTVLAAIKTVLNKTLDPAFSASANIFTNQSGLDVMDQLDDGTGRPLLQPDPSAPTAFRVKGRPVVILSDAHWPNLTSTTRARIGIGDGKQFMTLFRRNAFEFASTNIGGSSWRSNSTEVRGIARLDSAAVDTGAMALLKVTLP